MSYSAGDLFSCSRSVSVPVESVSRSVKDDVFESLWGTAAGTKCGGATLLMLMAIAGTEQPGVFKSGIAAGTELINPLRFQSLKFSEY